MLKEGEIKIISSAYRKILVQVSIVLQPSPSDFQLCDNVINKYGKETWGHGATLSDAGD